MAPAPVPSGRRARRAGVGALACLALGLVAGCGGGTGAGTKLGGSPTSTASARATATTPATTSTTPATPRVTATRPPRARRPKPELARAPDPAVLARKSGLAGAGAAKTTAIAEGAPSDAEVRRELAQAMGYKGGKGASTHDLVNKALLGPDGLVTSPPSAPLAVQAIITGGNQVARLPYVYGGGHGHWEDSAYDCSGSLSFALASAGFLKTQLDSSALAHWGAPGPGKWVTIYANASHAWMVVAGIRFDTSGRTGQRGSRWQPEMRSTAGFTVRHPKGL